MLSLIRGGPRILLVEPEGPAFADDLARLGRDCRRFEEAFESGDGASTIVALVSALGRGGEPVRLAELERVFLVPLPVEEFLLRLLEPGRPPLRGVRMAPRIVLFRGVGDLDAVVGRIEEELGAFPGRLLDLLDREDSGSIVCVSGASLEGRVGFADLHPIALHVPLAARSPLELENELRRNGLRYLNAGRGDRDWTDLEIKVYDRYEEYGLQLERIVRVVNALELGLILGESWSTDSPRFLMSIDVYRLRLLSFLPAERVKGLLLGLEYLDDGLRVGDYDLFREERKVHWSDAQVEGLRERKELGLRFRRELLGLLPEGERSALASLEARLRASRRD